jgi:acyl carrier protein
MANPLTYIEFQSFLSNALSIPTEELTPEASLLNDLAVDSLKLVELMLRFENQLGVSIPSQDAWEINTVGDAYNYYAEHFEG